MATPPGRGSWSIHWVPVNLSIRWPSTKSSRREPRSTVSAASTEKSDECKGPKGQMSMEANEQCRQTFNHAERRIDASTSWDDGHGKVGKPVGKPAPR